MWVAKKSRMRGHASCLSRPSVQLLVEIVGRTDIEHLPEAGDGPPDEDIDPGPAVEEELPTG